MHPKQFNHISYIKLNLQADSTNLNYSPNSFKQKRTNQSTNNIFGLPQSVLQKYKPPEKNNSKNQIQRKNHLENTLEYGEIAISYQQNLRKTILNHTKALFTTKKRHKSFIQPPTQHTLQLDNIRSKRTQKQIQNHRNHSSLNTLSILQKVILANNNNNYHIHQKPNLELQSNKLPLISKLQLKKQTKITIHTNLHLWKSPSPEKQLNKPTYSHTRPKPKPIEKPQICGWENIDISDY